MGGGNVYVPPCENFTKVGKFSLVNVLHIDVRSYNDWTHKFRGVPVAPTILIDIRERLHVDL